MQISTQKFELTAVQGHPSLQGHRPWCQSKARMQLPVFNSNFGRISYRFRDIDA